MKNTKLATLALFAALAPAAAQAQIFTAPIYAQQQPLYPYAVPQQQTPHYLQPQGRGLVQADYERFRARRGKPTNHALVEELRRRGKVERSVKNTTVVVREKPIVIEKKRYVDDTRVIERRHYVEDAPVKPRSKRSRAVADNEIDLKSEKGRVIRAEAEVTILGPDRMSIRLFRKRGGANANARAE
jgi:hypothetical protein